MTFEYRARNSEGALVTGRMDAGLEQQVLETLGAKDLLVVELKRIETQSKAPRQARAARVPLMTLATFTRQLATMLRAGLPLAKALTSLHRQARDRGLQAALHDVIGCVNNGLSLSQACERHPGVFSPLYVSIMRAGETGGALPEMLERLASFLETSLRLRQKIRSAMMYPLIVSVMGTGICIFLVTKIIPIFADIFKEFNHKLPLPTLVLIETSNFIRSNLIMVGLAAVGLGMAVRFYRHTASGARLWDTVKLRLPVFGPLAQKVAMSRFARTFATLTTSGVPVLQTVDTVASAVNNVVLEEAVRRVGEYIEKGSTMLEAMERQKVFPPMMLEMVSAGEQSGTVDEMLVQVADHFDREIETTLAGLTSLLEPLLILVMGVVVGGVVVAMFLPIFKMTDVVQF